MPSLAGTPSPFPAGDSLRGEGPVGRPFFSVLQRERAPLNIPGISNAIDIIIIIIRIMLPEKRSRMVGFV